MEECLLYHISQLATPKGNCLQHGNRMRKLEVITDAAVFIADGRIRETGTTNDLLGRYGARGGERCRFIDLTGHAVLPGFVDSHTHFLFGGYRPEEFLMRLGGTGYMDIMRLGGGIQNTVDATRAASPEKLEEEGRKRLADMLSMGVTTVEGKSGYGLDRECELKQLRVMKKLDQTQPVDIVPTYLGAHAIPREYKGNGDGYIDFMLHRVLPQVKEEGLARFCDVFCEEGVFSALQSRRLLEEAKAMGFEPKIHADEIVSLGGGELACELQAVSADHLLAVSDSGIDMLAASETTATLLPCTAFCLAKPYAPARRMIDSGCGVALASDYNPGSCFTNSIPLMLALAVIHMGMTMEEAICAMTLNGAAALGCADTIGSIEAGKKADLVILAYPDYRFLVYHTGKNIVETVIKEGKIVYGSEKESGREQN